MLGACSELGICEGDLGKMQSREVGESGCSAACSGDLQEANGLVGCLGG